MMIRKYVAVLLIFAMIVTLSPVAVADSQGLTLDVEVDGKNYSLRVLCTGDDWYAEVEDLAVLGNNKVSINREMNIVSIVKMDANGDLICILYSEDMDKTLEYCGDYYVPLQKASVETGVFFYDTDPLRATALRTPKQMLAEMEDILGNQRYQITQILLVDGYAVGATFAHIYATLPFVGSGSILGAVSGSDQANRYRNAMTAILQNDGEMTGLMDEMKNMEKQVHDNAELMKAVKELTEKGGKLYDFLLSKGVPAKLLDALAYEENPYEYFDRFFEDWSTVLDSINFGYFLELCEFYSVAVDIEESILVAMKRVFENSDDENSRKAVRNLLDSQYGSGAFTVADIYGGMLWDITSEYIGNKSEELFYGDYASGTMLAAKGIDMVTGASDKSEAFIYFPIFASIQQDLYSYFKNHCNDGQSHTMYDLRAVTIMYLKAAIAAYEFAAFDESLDDALANASKMLNGELAYILSYTENEYGPDYTNQNIIDWLNDGATETEPVESQYPSTEELFDGTCWSMIYGQTLGSLRTGLFQTDGTILIYEHGPGTYIDGSYEYDQTTGTLIVTFNPSGIADRSDEFEYGGTSFSSVLEYEMQVGKEHLIISPSSDGMRYFEENPEETEPPETEPGDTRSGYSVEMLLEGGMDLLLAVCDDFQYSEGYDDYGAGHLDGEEFTVAFDSRTGVIERITIWKMGGSLEITDGVYSDMSYEELKNAWGNTYDWSDIQYEFPYGGSNPETDVHDAYVEFAWGESGSGSSDWSSWSWDRQSVGANQEEEVRTVWGYYYYLCEECGAHWHGYDIPCFEWGDGCGAASISRDFHKVWSTVSWEEANLQDWHRTGKYYTYLDGELVFKWSSEGSKQQYRYRTVGSSTPAYQVTLSFCTPIAETGNIPVVQLITIERTRTGRSGGELADGEYYGQLLDWDDSNMTIELLDFQGWYEESMNRILESTGRNVSLDTTHSSVWLEWAWMDEGSDVWCSSIDAALDTKIWGGDSTVRESCTMTIYFTVVNGAVDEIVILYAA